jgi:hypothetical protein
VVVNVARAESGIGHQHIGDIDERRRILDNHHRLVDWNDCAIRRSHQFLQRCKRGADWTRWHRRFLPLASENLRDHFQRLRRQRQHAE